MYKYICIALMYMAAAAPAANGLQPDPTLHVPVEKMIRILTDSQFQGSGQPTLWERAGDIIDFRAMAMLVLSHNWDGFTPRQRDEFTLSFARFLDATYLKKLSTRLQDSDFIVLKHEQLNRFKAAVSAKIMRWYAEIPISYSLLKRNRAWRIYDVKINGISFLNTYRNQFGKILKNRSPGQLIEQLNQKIATGTRIWLSKN